MGRILLLLLLGIGSARAETAAFHSDASEFAAQQLNCEGRFSSDPAPFLRYLARNGYMRPGDVRHADSISCWSLRRNYRLDDLSIYAVCASTYSDFLRDENPGYFFRDPGTNAGIFAVFTMSPRDRAARWVSEHLRSDPSGDRLIIFGDARDKQESASMPRKGIEIGCQY